MNLISEIEKKKDKLFTNFKNIANFETFKCTNLFFNKNNIFENSANYMLIILIILSIFSIVTFYRSDLITINKYMLQFSLKKDEKEFYNYKITNNNKENKDEKITIKIKDNDKTVNILKLNEINNQKQNEENFNCIKINVNPINNLDNIIDDQIKNNNVNKSKKKKKKKKKKLTQINKIDKIIDSNNSLKPINKDSNQSTILIPYNDNEKNSLNYEEALKEDERTYIQYYFSLLKTKHIILFTFLYQDYNSRIIKIYIFFFTFYINYVVSAMFYTDSTMHKIYMDEGSFDFTYQLPQMFYSLIISSIVKMILNKFGLYEDNILLLKKDIKQDEEKKKELFKIKCKILSFFIITYLILIFSWIYLGCFSAVYKNTQIHVFLDVLSSFGISFITPIFKYLIPGFFRIPSLNKNTKRPLLFKISKILQLL